MLRPPWTLPRLWSWPAKRPTSVWKYSKAPGGLSAFCPKAPFLGRIAAAIPTRFKQRVIYGLSTGTLDEALARAIEPDSPLLTKRLEALKELQQEGFRTFAMLCPILPQDPVAYAKEAAKRIDFAACEHVWAEVLNRRGASMQRTAQALEEAGLTTWAQRLHRVFGTSSTPAWEAYGRDTFNALADVVPEIGRAHV